MATAKKAAPAKKTAAKTTATKAPAKKTPAKATPKETKHAPTHSEIAALAYKYSKERGHHHGDSVQDWLHAERELSGK